MIEYDYHHTESVRFQLKELYEKRWYKNGICKMFDDCRGKKIPKDYWLLFDRTVRLGDNYCMLFNDKPLRIVFMGKETLGFSDHVVRPALMSDFPEGLNRHYAVTLKTLRYMLNADKNALTNDTVLSMYSLTNLYSCAFCNYPEQTQGIPNSTTQIRNCLTLKKEEMEILKPTVLVLQTKDIRANDLYEDAIDVEIVLPDNYGKLKYSNKNECYIIESCHPSNKHHPWKKDLYACINYLKDNTVLPN